MDECAFVCSCGDPCVSSDPVSTKDGLTYCVYHWKVHDTWVKKND